MLTAYRELIWEANVVLLIAPELGALYAEKPEIFVNLFSECRLQGPDLDLL